MTEIPRDQYERPIIKPVGGGRPEPYTRVSTMARSLDNGWNLTLWKMRMVAKGLSIAPDLLARVRQMDVTKDRVAFDKINESAMEMAGGSARANLGTAMHSITDDLDLGRPLTIMEPWQETDLEAYQKATKGSKMLAAEQFVVIDELRCAGTFDRVWQLPDGTKVVGDLKTGDTADRYPASATCQIAAYAHGTLYTVEDGRTYSLESLGVSQTLGLMVHLPAGQGVCNIYELDLTKGWEAALLAKRVHTYQAVANKTQAIRREF